MAVDVSRKDWHVLTKTENGTVSLIRNLSLAAAVQVYDSLFEHLVSGHQTHSVQDSDIVKRDLLGPDGWDGCKKAAAHTWPEMTEKECEGGPNKGRLYRYGTCINCGWSRIWWSDSQPSEIPNHQNAGVPNTKG